MRILFGTTTTTARDAVIAALASLVGTNPTFEQRNANYYWVWCPRLEQIDYFKDLTATVANIPDAYFTVTALDSWVADFAEFRSLVAGGPSQSFVELTNHPAKELELANGVFDFSGYSSTQENEIYTQIAFSMVCANEKTPYIKKRTASRTVVYLDHTNLVDLDISGAEHIVQDVEYRWSGDPSPNNYQWIWQADDGDPFTLVKLSNVKFAPGLEIDIRKNGKDPGVLVVESCDMTEGGMIDTRGCSNVRVHHNTQLGNTEIGVNDGDYDYFWRCTNGFYKAGVHTSGDVARTRVVPDAVIPTRADYPAPTVNQAPAIDGSEIYHRDSFTFDSVTHDHDIDVGRFGGHAGIWEFENVSSALKVSSNFFFYVLNVWVSNCTFGDAVYGTRDGAIQREWVCLTLTKNCTFTQPAIRSNPPRVAEGVMNWGRYNYSHKNTYIDCDIVHTSNAQPNLHYYITEANGGGNSRLYVVYYNVNYYADFANTWAHIVVTDSQFGRFRHFNKWNAGSGNIMRTGDVIVTDTDFINSNPIAAHVWENEGGKVTMTRVNVQGPCTGSRIYNKVSSIPDGGSVFTDVVDKGEDGLSNNPVPTPPTSP